MLGDLTNQTWINEVQTVQIFFLYQTLLSSNNSFFGSRTDPEASEKQDPLEQSSKICTHCKDSRVQGIKSKQNLTTLFLETKVLLFSGCLLNTECPNSRFIIIKLLRNLLEM